MALFFYLLELLRRLFLVTVLGLCGTGCAVLQDVGYLNDPMLEFVGPTVSNAQGLLSKKSTHALLVSRWKNTYADTSALASLEEIATSNPLIAGNKVTLLYDGPQTMAAMMQAVRAAKNHINLENYIFDQDEVGIEFAELLMARQRAGVQVHVIYDAVGTIATPQAFFDKMRDAGIHLLAFNPLTLAESLEINQRDHRKILVVDGLVAFTGGVNISSTYANSSLFHSKSRSKAKVGWRDTHIKLEGPAVAALQWEFLSNWANQKSISFADSNFFPVLVDKGNKIVRVLASEPEGGQEIYRAYLLAINAARKSVHITTAYFAPDAHLLQALKKAAQRGVEVKIILAGVKESGFVFYAGHSFYRELLESGVKLYQLQVAVLHAKTAVIDSVWSTVGSANLDQRSFLHNYELNVVVYDLEFGESMDSAFLEDLRFAPEVALETWNQRPIGERLKEWFARRLEYWL
jgi:cardiolipin synthase